MTEINNLILNDVGTFSVIPNSVIQGNDQDTQATNNYCSVSRFAYLNITNPTLNVKNITAYFDPFEVLNLIVIPFPPNVKEMLIYFPFIFPVNKTTSSNVIILFDNNKSTSFYFISNFNCKESPKEWETSVIGSPSDSELLNNYVTYFVSLMISNVKDATNPSFVLSRNESDAIISMHKNGGSNKYYRFQISINSEIENKPLLNSVEIKINSPPDVPTTSLFSINLPKYNYNTNSIQIKNNYAIRSKGYYSTIVHISNPSLIPIIKLYQKVLNKRYGFLLPGEGTIKEATYYFSFSGSAEAETNSTLYSLDSSGTSVKLGSINNFIGIASDIPSSTTTYDSSFTKITQDIPMYISSLLANQTSPDSLINNDSGFYFSNKYPFGITSKFQNSFQKSIVSLLNDQLAYKLRIDSATPTGLPIPTLPIDTKSPEIISFSVTTYNGLSKIMRAHITDSSGFNYLIFSGGIKMTSSNLVQGNLFDGIYEMVFTSVDSLAYDYSSASIQIFDIYLNTATFYFVYGSVYPSLNYIVPPVSSIFNEFNFTTFYFNIPKSTTIDTTNVDTKVTLYFNTTYPLIQITPFISLSKPFYNTQGLPVYVQNMYRSFSPGYWNKTISMYQIDFQIPRNQFPTSSLDYSIVFGGISLIKNNYIENIFSSNASISVTSNYADKMGPLVSVVEYLSSKTVSIGLNDPTKQIGWRFTFKDFNGVKNGTIVVKSKELYYEQTFKFNKSDINENNQYTVSFPIESACSSQTFTISRIALEDEAGYKSDTDTINYPNQHINPFVLYNDTSQLDITIVCSGDSENDFIGPILNHFEVSPTKLDAGVQNKTINVLFSVSDTHGVNVGILPFVYFSSYGFNVIQVECTFVNSSISGGDNIVFYKASLDPPIGFGYPYGILISIYGLFDVFGNIRGYPTDLISQIKGTKLKIDVSSMTLNSPFISDISSINTWGGILTISGFGFGADGNDSKVQVDYMDGLGFRDLTHQFNSALLKVVYIKPTDYSFNIRIFNTASQIYSPIKLVRPIGEKERPPQTPPPTNPPPTCKENCGGPDQGVCSNQGVCTCFSPWIGPTCQSKIITITPPLIDDTKPVINLTLPNENGEETTSKPTDEIITSLINIVSLRELDINNNLVFEYKFEKWIFNDNTKPNAVNSEYLYSNTISIVSKENSDIIDNCTVDVSVQWFKEKTDVTFANSTFTIEPSSIKYNVNISSYPFTSKLNTLQLVMLVSIQSSKTNDICSNKEFDIADSDNQYLKLTVNQKSIYGLFINRGIIDDRIVSIKNTLLDGSTSFKNELVDDARTSQSFIAVNVPYFTGLACLDPSFSVLVDSQSTESGSNSICSLSTHSGLSTSQIAGIVVGSVVFCALLISFIIIFVKSSKGKIILKSIHLKRF